jgi:8-oxo-dGTP diphosphatase
MRLDFVVAGYIFHDRKVLLIHHRKLELWLPPGGHINRDETPDDALAREIKEETNLDIEIFNPHALALEGNIKTNLATPFSVNVHTVGDHDHCCFFYACKALNAKQLKTNGEVLGHMWVTRKELSQEKIPEDVRNLALKAFDLFDKEINC